VSGLLALWKTFVKAKLALLLYDVLSPLAISAQTSSVIPLVPSLIIILRCTTNS